ncbi:DHA2 family efflux MFS transporter permease subunit [Streptomyces piniterrae]|uniref:DHA2 family efflux MFS transporter permease subunit n=1 Tax=Streptomyces piniterrae TaxID=2571125 RepID=A0A4U0NFV9_9ACTN|nr:DHA2 family efflux MFS transporter permease subunit [Streptomyces piniterrae]TJZ52940.1 DHA2 family efflux MFS transporter permease subunit [Streptomyces piniterrae]
MPAAPTLGDTAAGSGTPTGRPREYGVTALASVVVLGSLMTVLDTTIVNVALNRLSRDFHAPLAAIQWVATGYTLALAAVIPLTAWAIGRFGTKRLYLLAIGAFALGSALAGLAWNTESLIAFRVLQGLAGGAVQPVGMTILIRASDPAHRGRMMSILGLPVLVGPLIGPVLGGYLVDEVSWRWIFLINIPVGVLTLVLGARFFRRDTPQPTSRLDLPGLLTLSPGLALLIYGLSTGAERHTFTTAGVLLPTLLGAALVVAFVIRALTARDPLIDLRLLRHGPFGSAAATLALFVCGYFGSMLLLPLYYQVVRGQSATGAGLLGIPQVVTTGITMQFAGRLVDKVAPRRLIMSGVALAATGFLAFTTQVAADTPYAVLLAALAVMGIGVGMTMMPTMASATRNVDNDRIPAASTTLSIIPQIASSIGGALMSVLLAGAIADRLPGTMAGGLEAVHALPAGAVRGLAPQLAEAFQHTYVWAVALVALALLPALFLPRGKREAV